MTNHYRSILTFVEDNSPGVHDTLFATCDPGLDLVLGIDANWVPAPVNFFQNTPVLPDGKLVVERAMTKAGDNVVLRAEIDLYLIVTACSVDEVDINGGVSTPMRIEIQNT